MSTPEPEANKVLAGVQAEIAKLGTLETKIKTLWQRWEPYAIAVVCLIVGAVIGHKL